MRWLNKLDRKGMREKGGKDYEGTKGCMRNEETSRRTFNENYNSNLINWFSSVYIALHHDIYNADDMKIDIRFTE
jgi:hypothetical protein